MQKRRTIRCGGRNQRFVVVRVGNSNGNPLEDTFAGRSFEDAMDNAMPDPGNRVRVYATCAPDIASARMFGPKELIRDFVYRGGGRRSPAGQGRRWRRKKG